jgi:hypothetical protein
VIVCARKMAESETMGGQSVLNRQVFGSGFIWVFGGI